MTVEWTKKRIEMLEAQLEEKDRVIAHVENQVDGASDELARHDRTLVDKADQIANLIEKNDNQRHTIERLQTEATDRLKRHRKDNEQAEGWKNGVDELNRMLHEAEELNRQRLAIIADRTNEIAGLKDRLNDQYSTWERERQLKEAYTAAIQKAMSDFGIKFGWVDDEELGFLEASADGVSAHISDLKSELDSIRTGR